MNRHKKIEKATLAVSVFVGVSGAGLLGACAQGLNAFPNWGEVRGRGSAK